MYIRDRDVEHSLETHQSFKIFDFFFSSRRRHTRFLPVSWARRCVQETGYIIYAEIHKSTQQMRFPQNQNPSLASPFTQVNLPSPCTLLSCHQPSQRDPFDKIQVPQPQNLSYFHSPSQHSPSEYICIPTPALQLLTHSPKYIVFPQVNRPKPSRLSFLHSPKLILFELKTYSPFPFFSPFQNSPLQ
eukprot:TRINITY_DN3040_c0_g1_i14.p2 TRINITY_DN3040_c0_g1~~TRINITY_DN3040_c0_g1_i14.p2  ORF type:complete len:187 (+),score=20.83 TRINITY_DN3040_c0_g1_i14:1-561(+)